MKDARISFVIALLVITILTQPGIYITQVYASLLSEALQEFFLEGAIQLKEHIREEESNPNPIQSNPIINQDTLNNESVTYTYKGYKMEIPADWSILENTSSGSIDILSSDTANIHISSYLKSQFQNMSTEDISAYYNGNLISHPEIDNLSYFKPSDSGLSIVGQPAFKFLYDVKLVDSNNSFKAMSVGAEIGNRLVVISYISPNDTFNTKLPNLLGMINSMRVA